MNKLVFRSLLASLVLAGQVACSKTPGSPSVSFTAPQASQPANGSTFKFKAQPVTLAIVNAVRVTPVPATYSLEVATDAGFANKVYTKDGIAEGSGSTTSVDVSGLPGGATYYWRLKSVVDNVVSAPTPTQSFVVQPQIIISVPAISEPLSGVTVAEARPKFSTRNAARTGLVGTIFYEFQVSSSPAFSTITASATVQENSSGTTTWTPAADLPTASLFWRVRATDPSNTEVSAFTNATGFTVQPFDLQKAFIYNNPPDFKNWAETAKITLIDYSSGQVVVDFDKREGPGRWPDVGFGGGSLEYTLGMCFNLGGQWHCSAAIQFWFGRELEAGGERNHIGDDWFYDARWGPMAGHQPRDGELVGIYVAAGNLRDSGNVIAKERSDIVIIPYGQNYRR
jgi:hypothetical protein